MSEDQQLPTGNAVDVHGKSAVQQNSNIPLGWKPTPAEPVPVVRCVTIKKNGERCKRWSLRGYNKCYRHSGSGNLPNVQKYCDNVIEAARLRLLDNADYAIDVLEELMQPGTSEGVRLKASTEVLDRAGVRGGFEVDTEVTVTVSAADTIAERLSKLRKGAEASAVRKQQMIEDEVIDADIVEDDGQETLF